MKRRKNDILITPLGNFRINGTISDRIKDNIKFTKENYKTMKQISKYSIKLVKGYRTTNYPLLGVGYAVSGAGMYAGTTSDDIMVTAMAAALFTATAITTGLEILNNHNANKDERIMALKTIKKAMKSDYKKTLKTLKSNNYEGLGTAASYYQRSISAIQEMMEITNKSKTEGKSPYIKKPNNSKL